MEPGARLRLRADLANQVTRGSRALQTVWRAARSVRSAAWRLLRIEQIVRIFLLRLLFSLLLAGHALPIQPA